MGDRNMWQRYVTCRNMFSQKYPDGCTPPNVLDGLPESGHVKTGEMEHLNTKINEFYLWHGSSSSGALGVAEDGFRLDLAGTNAGTMFGRGAYFAECSSKSD